MQRAYDRILEQISQQEDEYGEIKDVRMDWLFIHPWNDKYLLYSASHMDEHSMATTSIHLEQTDKPCLEAIDNIISKIQRAFKSTIHNTTYWEEKVCSINHQLAQAYCTRGGDKEASIREERVRPFLTVLATAVNGLPCQIDILPYLAALPDVSGYHTREILTVLTALARVVSNSPPHIPEICQLQRALIGLPLPSSQIPEFKTGLIPEASIASSVGADRRTSSKVDYLLYGRYPNGKYVYLVPVEVKKKIDKNDYYQLAWYMMRLSMRRDIQRRMLVGLLIDATEVVVCFSPFQGVCTDCNRNHPLPLILATPKLPWIRSDHGHAPNVNMDTFIFLGLLLQCYIERGKVEESRDLYTKISCILLPRT